VDKSQAANSANPNDDGRRTKQTDSRSTAAQQLHGSISSGSSISSSSTADRSRMKNQSRRHPQPSVSATSSQHHNTRTLPAGSVHLPQHQRLLKRTTTATTTEASPKWQTQPTAKQAIQRRIISHRSIVQHDCDHLPLKILQLVQLHSQCTVQHPVLLSASPRLSI
jgi:hypothetical protein